MNRAANSIVSMLLVLLLPISTFGQADIPIGAWRVHPSFNAIRHISLESDQRIFAAAQHGIIVLGREDNTIKTYSTLDGLKGSPITGIEFDETSGILVIAYMDGTFDLLDRDNIITAYDPPANSLLTGSKQINDIFFNANLCLISTDYGVVVFDVEKRQIKETWRDLGSTGNSLKVVQCTMHGDSVFLATESGVIAGNLKTNLQDFSKWKRYAQGDLAGPIKSINTFGNVIRCAINGKGIYRLVNGVWNVETYLQGEFFNSLTSSSSSLVVATESTVWKISVANDITALPSGTTTRPFHALEDGSGTLWIGDATRGLLSEKAGIVTAFLPNAPTNQSFTKLQYGGKIFGVSGGSAVDGTPLNKPGVIDAFYNGSWSSQTSALKDLTNITQVLGTDGLYVSSFGGGIEVRPGNGVNKVWDETNSTLTNVNPPEKSIYVTSMVYGSDGLWATNYGSSKSLHLLRADNTWQSFTLPVPAARYPVQITTDHSENVWMVIDPLKGGGVVVFNKEQNAVKYLSDVDGQGGLPSKSVYSIVVDVNGLVWIGTELGVAYFNGAAAIFSSTVNAIKPVVDGRFLLRDDRVTSIAVDGGNRKWFGTQRGIWLYAPDGDVALENFTTANSPLPSDNIVDIAINHNSGEVFFATIEGLASFRSGATKADLPSPLKIFPNPVYADFTGTVGISGTPTDAIIKITDVSGKLVWQTRANGETATWNVLDYKGRRVPTGVYIVFVVSDSGEQHLASRIAVID